VRRVFEQWARLEAGDVFGQQSGLLQDLSRDLQLQLDSLTTDRDSETISDQVLSDLYNLLGSVRGLIDAMANTQAAVRQINWQQWAATRF